VASTALSPLDNAAVSKYGYIATYPGDALTATWQIPFKNGISPNHRVLDDRPCKWDEMTGI